MYSVVKHGRLDVIKYLHNEGEPLLYMMRKTESSGHESMKEYIVEMLDLDKILGSIQ